MPETDFSYSDIQNFKYRLAEDLVVNLETIRPRLKVVLGQVQLSEDGTLKISEGYLWNGSSGPTIDTESTMRASLVHDAIYSLMAAGALPSSYRHKADDIYLKLCLEDGMPRWRAKTHFYALKFFGGNHAIPR